MKEKKHIVDTTLRDGEQSPGIALNMEDKAIIAGLLDDLGVYEIEAGVPCLSTLETESILKIIQNKKKSKISVWSRMNLDDIRHSISCKPDIIHIGAPVSYIQIYSKLKKNKAWMLKTLLSCVEEVKSRNIDITVGLEDSSRSDMGFVLGIINELYKNGVNTIRIADTVGILTPNRTKEMIETIKAHSDIKIEMHVHNDLGMAVANSIIGAKSGADYIDCTLFGIGERTGNCNLYEFVHSSEAIFQFDMSTKQIKKLEKKVFCYLSAAM